MQSVDSIVIFNDSFLASVRTREGTCPRLPDWFFDRYLFYILFISLLLGRGPDILEIHPLSKKPLLSGEFLIISWNNVPRVPHHHNLKFR